MLFLVSGSLSNLFSLCLEHLLPSTSLIKVIAILPLGFVLHITHFFREIVLDLKDCLDPPSYILITDFDNAHYICNI